MDYALNKKEVEKIAGKPINMVRYQDLDNMYDINEIFYDYNNKITEPIDCALIHFQTSHNNTGIYGHWCIICRNGKDLYFFDPYGTYIDDQLEHIDPEYNELIGQNYPYLSNLLGYSDYNIHYNPYRLQKFNGSQVCGRYCGAFARFFDEFDNMDDFGKEFLKYEKKGYDLDKVIIALTDQCAGFR